MKVLFIHRHCGVGGVSTVIRSRYVGLKQLGIEADYLFLNDYGGKKIFSDLDIRLYQLKDHNEIAKIIYGNTYDFISSIDCPELHGLLNTLPHTFKILCEVHTPYPDQRAYLKKADLPSGTRCIVTPSETFKEIIRNERSAFRDIPIHVIPNPVEERFLVDGDHVKEPFNKKYVGWIGRLDKMKNYQEGLKIAEECAAFRDDVEFIFVGRFPSGGGTQLFPQILKFKGRTKFKWLPFIPHQDVHRFYGLLRESGGCYLSTSLGENQSCAALESMASKCPVVTTDIEVFKELLEDGRCGSIYKSGNVRDAVDTINKILDDRVLRDAITDSAYTKVLERFTVEKVSLKWEKLLKSLE